MIKILFILILCAFSTECFSQEKQVEIYLGKASVEFASKNGVKPLTDKEREGYDYICENMTSPMLKILNVTVDDSRRMIVAVKKIPNADYNTLSKYVFDCSEYVYEGLKSCICIDGNSIKKQTKTLCLQHNLENIKNKKKQ
ncbi:MAG: hypothetical protein RR370_02945 [Synergistaceae bacterium]